MMLTMSSGPILTVLVISMLFSSMQSLTFDLPSRGAEECFEHEASEGAHGLLTYFVVSGGKVAVTLRDAAGRHLHQDAAASFGEQSFTTSRGGRIVACFRSPQTGMAHHTIRFRFIFDEALAALDKTTDLPKKRHLSGAEEILQDMFAHAESVEFVQENIQDAVDRRYNLLLKGISRVKFVALLECLSALMLAAAQALYVRSLFSGGGKGSLMGRMRV